MKKLLNTLYVQSQGSYLRQEGETVVVGLDGGVALDEVAELRIVAVVEPEVVGGDFSGDEFFIQVEVAKQTQFGGRTDVGHMEAGAVTACALDGMVG